MWWRASRQRFELPDAIFFGPHERVYDVAFNKRWVAGKPNDIASLIDSRRRIPPRGWRIRINIRRSPIFPKHGMLGCVPSNGLVTDTGDAHNLTNIIDRGRGSGAVAGV